MARGLHDTPMGTRQKQRFLQGKIGQNRCTGLFRGLIESGQRGKRSKAPFGILCMDIDRSGEGIGQLCQGGQVIGMTMRHQDGRHGGFKLMQAGDELAGIVSGVDDNGFMGLGIRDKITIFFKKAGGPCFNVHQMKSTDLNECVKGGGDAVLTASGLGVGFTPEGGCRLEVVGAVNLELRPGRMVALVGESGCGKSITAVALGGLLPRGMQMDEGELRWASGGACEPGRGLAYVFQDPGECLNPVFTIGNQIREVLPKEDRIHADKRMDELLRTVGFDDPARVQASYPHQLSGGMQQRAMLAMALAGRPRVLVADEPTTALDVTVQAKILRLLAELQRREQLAVLLITHNLAVVAEVADHLHVMYAGRVVESGPVSLLEDPFHPYVKGLLNALPRLDENTETLDGIDGSVPPLGRRPSGCRFHPRCPIARIRCIEEEPTLQSRAEHRLVACWACEKDGWS